MKQKECVIPEYCIGCGKVFDLWNYFRGASGKIGFASKESLHNFFDEHLCDSCKEDFIIKDDVMKYKDDEFDDIENSDGNFVESYEVIGENMNKESDGIIYSGRN